MLIPFCRLMSLFLRQYFLLIILFACQVPAISQGSAESPYQLSTNRELLIGGAGALTFGIGTLLQNNLAEPLRAELSVPTYEQINGFDRLGSNVELGDARRLSDYGLNLGAALPAVLFLGKRQRRDFLTIGLLYAETMGLVGGLTNVTKAGFGRARPYVYGPDWDPARPLESGDRASFISGHTSLSAAGSFFFARVFADYHPESRWRPVVWGVAALLPATTGYLRVRAARHFPSDVIAGYLVGASVGMLVPVLHRREGRVRLRAVGAGVSLRYSIRSRRVRAARPSRTATK